MVQYMFIYENPKLLYVIYMFLFVLPPLHVYLADSLEG